jgi:hypothetical protein
MKDKIEILNDKIAQAIWVEVRTELKNNIKKRN